MKVIHLCFVEPYIDGWSYQANLLPEYQAKQGHDVVVIAGPKRYPSYLIAKGKEECAKSYWISRVKIIRIPLLINLFSRIILPYGLFRLLRKEKPDIIFMHSLNNLALIQVIRYKKTSGCKLYSDVHSDWYNSGRNVLSRLFLHDFFWRLVLKKYQKYLDKVFAITSDCAEFVKQHYKIDARLIDMLNLGADTDNIQYDQRSELRNEIRNEYDIADNDFVISTAGKINTEKKVDMIIDAVKLLGIENIKVFIIGSLDEGYKERLYELIDNDKRFIFTGWQESRRIIDFFLASDIAVFPGTQSVIWQAAICCGLPVILRWWGETVEYLNDGNAFFLQSDSIGELATHIGTLYKDAELREEMSMKARELCQSRLSYDVIAKKSLPDYLPGGPKTGASYKRTKGLE